MRKGLLLSLLFLTIPSFAQDTSLSSPVRVQHEKIKASKKKRSKNTSETVVSEQKRAELIQKKREERDAKASKWGYMADYRASSDLQQQNSKTVMHEISLGTRYRLIPDLYVSAGVSMNYDSVGTEVLADGQHAESYMGDVSLGLSSSFSPALFSEKEDRSQRISWSVDNEFPTSPYSRAEGYNSVTQGMTSWSFDFFDRLVFVTPNLLGFYIWNRYETSPTTQRTNKMGSLRLGLSVGLRVWQGLFFKVGGGVQTSRYTDGSNDASAKNSVGVGYNFKYGSVSLDFSNGTYADREETQLWFVDKYRRMVSLRTTLSF